MPRPRTIATAARSALISLLLPAAALAAVPPPAPVARVAPVTDSYFGHPVTDPYRWMESEPKPEFEQYLHAQDDHARAVLATIPGREQLARAISALDGLLPRIGMLTVANGRRFYVKRAAGAQIGRLVMRDERGIETVLVDPAKLDTQGRHAEIDQFAPSQDGGLVAYGISTGGSEASVLHVVDTITGIDRPDVIDRAQFASVSWAPDGRHFFYARLPKPVPGAAATAAYAHLRVFEHQLGENPDHDRLILDTDHLPFPFKARQAFAAVAATPGSAYLLATVSDGVSPEVALYAAPLASVGAPEIAWKQVAAQSDAVVGIAVRGGRVDLLTHKDAPHLRIVETDLHAPSFAQARTVVASGSGVLTDLALAADGLYLTRRDGAVMTLLRLRDRARIAETITLPFAGTIAPPEEDAGGLITDPERPGADISLVSWVHPLVWLHYDARSHAVTDTGIAPPFPRDLKPYQAIETRVTARDGTLIPLSIISRRDLQHDGQRPVLLDGYGAYGISYDPAFTPTILPWLDRGGVFAVAHVRGGGEGGQAWHDGGRITTKMNTITDFIACAEAMISRHYTDSAHLAGTGTSAGGILIGGAITQRPELFRAALIRVGATNSTRGEFTAGGPANIPEFGSVTNAAQFPSLLRMDAFQHVRDHAAYPAVLLTGGADDPRVTVWEPAKMAARLQAATSSGRPVLLRIEFDAGHGIGSTRDQRDQETADEQAFLLWQMGEPGFQPQP
ncbi:prolyl oligopeptidase family serine peptidase [Lichenicoccus sp.]|uniref:prolyl oligopeptidase family serine peptidase n=1 Tax=Lichenicoccus sp. TaxID=2781899 RepID=UPI003D0F7312